MALQQVFHATNVGVPAAPPTFFAPSSAGAAVPAGGTDWELRVDSAGYSVGSSADLAIEYEYSGIWIADVAASGFTLGTFTGKSGPTSVNTLSSSLGSRDAQGNRIGMYPDHVRLRIDRIPVGTIASVTVSFL